PPPPSHGSVRVFEPPRPPPSGTEPYRVSFSMCASRGDGLRFRFDFDGDGSTDQSGTACTGSRVYSTGGVSSSGRAAAAGPTTLAPRRSFYLTQMSVSDNRGNRAAENNTVEVVEAL